MSYSHRPLSPGGRRLQNPARSSDNILSDSSYYQRHQSYASPRSSTGGGVIPISTHTFVNVQPPPNPRPAQHYDSYSGRPRRSSLADTSRGSAAAGTAPLPSRSRPTVIQQDTGRPASPTKITARDAKDYYVVPASSHEPRTTTTTTTTTTHKKLYSVDGDGSARLVADVNIPVEAGGNRHHKRRSSVERGGHRSAAVEPPRDRGRRAPAYHPNGTHNRSWDKSIDDEDAYSYTDAAGMYRDTEPRWRDVRPRRGSVDRGGATSRERPANTADPSFGPRQPAKETGPPPSTRGWDRLNDSLGRTSSAREQPRVAQSPSRGRAYTEYQDPRDSHYVPPRPSSSDRRTTVHQPYDAYDYDREPRRTERRHSITRNDHRPDRSVERRGFGIASIAPVAAAGVPAAGAYREASQTRHGRGSDESFERSQYRDSGYALAASEPPHRREPAPPELHQHDYPRLEQEKRDREYAQRLQAEERPRPIERDVRDPQPRRDERAYDRDYDRERDRPRDKEYDRDRERERERERARPMEPPPSDRDRDRDRDPNRDRERHHERRGTDRGEHGRKESSPRQSGEAPSSKTGLSQASTGGLAGAAAAFGLTGLLGKVSDKRDKDKDREDEKERERERDRERERHERRREEEQRERDRERDKERGREKERERERERRPASDESPYERPPDRERERQREKDRGLGFAFEAPPDPPNSAPPIDRPPASAQRPDERLPPARTEDRVPDRAPDRAPERAAERAPESFPDRQTQNGTHERAGARGPEREAQYDNKPTAQMPATAVDPDQDYRRRMEQIQRELSHNPDSDPDRERRRREREQRRREREGRNGTGVGAAQMPAMPGSFADDVSPTTGPVAIESTGGPDRDLRRKPSVLDAPVTNASAQIIDNSLSDKRENRVRIVDPPTAEEEDLRRPKGILKKPTEKFPEHPDAIREGVAPLKDATKKGIPPGARWTKIDRRLVNPEALEASHERFEERLDCVIVLRVLTKEEIQKLADKTREIRDKRHDDDRKAKRSTRTRDRWERDECGFSDSGDEFKPGPPKLLEAPSTAGAGGPADFFRDHDRRHGEREAVAYAPAPGGSVARDDRSRDESRSRY